MLNLLSRQKASSVTLNSSERLELQECRSKLQAINTSWAVIEFELDGTIIEANQNFLDAVGYSLVEIAGKHHRMFVDDEYRQSLEYQQFWRTLGAGQYHFGEFQRVRKDGTPIWIQASYFPVTDSHGLPVKVVKFATDITNQVKLRERSRSAGGVVSDSITQMTSTISEISQVAGHTVELTRSTQDEVHATNAFVQELSTSSQKIENVVGLIRGLAAQTNLLALNATIESARAGEAGKGFAVVAHEVKELAKETASATENIVKSVADIQRLVGECLESAGRVLTSVGSVNESMTSVASAVEQQAATMAALREIAGELID